MQLPLHPPYASPKLLLQVRYFGSDVLNAPACPNSEAFIVLCSITWYPYADPCDADGDLDCITYIRRATADEWGTLKAALGQRVHVET